MAEPKKVTSRQESKLAALLGWAPYLVAGGLFVLALFGLSRLLHEVQLNQVVTHIRDTPASSLVLPFASTCMGYLCLAGYDWSALRHIGKRLPAAVVWTGGLMAYAFSNTVGLATISAGAVRWRVYSGLGLDAYDIATMSAFTAFAFGTTTTLIGLTVLVLQPDVLSSVLPFSATAMQRTALAALPLIILPVAWASFSKQSLRVKGFTLRAPRPSVLGTQMLVGVGDITFAALTLYLLLPPISIGFLGFLAIFIAAAVAGVVSHVPGGVGVFEAVIITALPPDIQTEQIAAALLLYRLIYYLIPFVLCLLLLALHAARQGLAGRTITSRAPDVSRVMEPVMRALNPLAPLLLAITTFGAGLWMTTSALLPPSTKTDETLLSVAFLEGSALIVSALGSTLIVLSLALMRRSLAAYWLVLIILAAGAGILFIENSTIQGVVLILFLAAMLPFHHIFRRRALLTHAALTPEWLMLVAAALSGLGFTLFFSYKSTPYSNDLWWQFAMDAHAPRALRAGLLAALTVGLSGLFLLLRIPRTRLELPDEKTLATVAKIASTVDDPDGAFALTGDKLIIMDDSARAFVMFGIVGHTWVAFGDPVGAPDAALEVAFEFVEAARQAGADPAFYEVGPHALPVMLEVGMALHKMGEEAVINLKHFSLEGSDRKRLRASYARAQREGLTLELAIPPHTAELIEHLRIISDEWLAVGKTREKGFSVGRFNSVWLNRWPIALVRHHGKIVAFANLMSTDTKQRATIDLMRHSRAAPRRTMDFLFVALMLELKTQGFVEFSLGTAPLSGLAPESSRMLWERFGDLIYRHGGRFYNFAGLRAFKEKFDPEWRPRYLATTSTHLPIAALTAAARLIGRKQPD